MNKYIWTLPAICSLMTHVFADAQGVGQPADSSAEKQKKYMQEMNQITPSAEPAVTRCADPFLTADFIWWRAQEEGLQYAFNGLSNANPGIAGNPGAPYKQADKGSTKRPDFDYEPGFKVGFGLKFRHDGWDAYAQYTWWRNEKNDTKSSVHRDSDNDSYVMGDIFCPSSIFAQGFFSGGVGQNGLIAFDTQSAEAKWSLHFNVLDLELGRNFWISKWLTLRPFVGMKFSWLDQDFDVEYEKIFATPNFQTKVLFDLDQFGVGLRAGLDSTWYMWKNWAVFGELAFTGLWNDFDSKRKDLFSNGSNPFQTILNLHDSNHLVSVVLEWALGLRFETAFHHDDFMFMLQAGWEQQVWFNQNQFILMPTASSANLNFEGLTLKAGFYF